MVQLRSIEISKDIQNRQPTRTITGTHDYRNPLHSLAAPEEIKSITNYARFSRQQSNG